MGFFQCVGTFCLCLVLVLKTCTAGSPHIGQMYPGFEASAKEWSNNNGRFLLSNNSIFGFGFSHALNDTLSLLVVKHISSGRGVWTANRGKLVEDSAKFVFDKSGNVSLHWGNDVVWSPDTSGEKVASMELWDSGNFVLLGNSGSILWQSFSNPTDTLLPGQEFSEGMRLESRLNKDNMRVYLEFKSGDLVLFAGYQTPQTYWSLANESRKTNNSVGGKIQSAILESNSWNFYDQNKALLWKFIFSENTDGNATWALILGSDGVIIFSNLRKGSTSIPEAIKIPQNFCSTPEPCGRYNVCYFFNQCRCPASLNSRFNCKPPIASACNSSRNSTELFFVGTKLDYFALAFVTPISRYSLDTCREACLRNCSCSVLFFENHSGNCFLFDSIGGFQRPLEGSAGYVSYMKVSHANAGVDPSTEAGGTRRKHILLVVLITISTILVISGILYVGIWYYRGKRTSVEISQENFEEDSFSNNFSGMPVRFSYDDLCRATKSFSIKVGQGGFGSVYLGTLPDGTQLAVKKLERIGQGMKEFRAEVNIFGNVRHIHLVKLRGFCAEGPHRLLVYEIWRFISITINSGLLHPQPTSYFKNSSLTNLLNSQSIHSMASSQASLLLQKQLKDLNKHPVEGFSAGLLNENNVFEWSVLIMGPPGTLYEGGFFSAIMSFPSNYPCNPPTLKFTSEIWHPNIYPDGKVCISILHPPGDDPNGYEVAAERWSAVHTVESIILSVIVMLSDPNVESPANIDAAKEWRENREVFKKKAARCARKSEDLFLSL
ncbi:hypothetical protein Patl1_34510 [Pistacia atlantica]|uniref:Uncharacterized protein n=1 Tax=Pistacia atlantica TaxID=434234 RepID=A0ACC0ZSX8_9ROSI|nr:hypothetical protein Patl1_34510 [Pistacia atlantica]